MIYVDEDILEISGNENQSNEWNFKVIKGITYEIT